ncbi:hypothetical protein LQZ19_03580 [Treponema primitia]
MSASLIIPEDRATIRKPQIIQTEENGFNLDIKNPHIPKEKQQYSSGELLTMLHKSFRKSDELVIKLKKELSVRRRNQWTLKT